MNKKKIIIIDNDDHNTHNFSAELSKHYDVTIIDDLNSLDIEKMGGRNTMFLIDPNSFDRKASSVFKELLLRRQNVVAAAFGFDNYISESAVFKQGILEFIKKPWSPSVNSEYIHKRFEFLDNLYKKGLSTKDFIELRTDFRGHFNREINIELVEDSPEDANRLFQILQPECNIRWHKTENEFYNRSNKSVPDLIILDIVLEGQSAGPRILKHIKDDPNLQDVPVIFSTSSWQVKRIAKGLQLGASDYIRKVDKDEAAIRSRIFTNIVFSALLRSNTIEYA